MNMIIVRSTMVFLLLAFFGMISMQGQTVDLEKEFDAEYAKRIKKSRIDDVYIPKDFEDAFVELTRLSHPEDLKKFAAEDEYEVCRKLHFGLGKWIMVNWHFHEGSRFSHFIKSQGVYFPDDMVQMVLRSFHRHLNDRPLELDNLASEYIEMRKAERDKILKDAETIGKRQRPKEE